MMDLNGYAKKYNRDKNNNFAIACYENNSIQELIIALDYIDERTCSQWRIKRNEYIDAVSAAIEELKKDNEKN